MIEAAVNKTQFRQPILPALFDLIALVVFEHLIISSILNPGAGPMLFSTSNAGFTAGNPPGGYLHVAGNQNFDHKPSKMRNNTPGDPLNDF